MLRGAEERERRYPYPAAKEQLDAVVVASATSVHAEQTMKAIEKGLHVLCEKPLSTTVKQVMYL